MVRNWVWSKWIGWALIAGMYAVLWAYKKDPPYTLVVDETHYWTTALQFSREPLPGISLLRNYPELNTPLPFMTGGWIIHFFGENIRYLRLYNLALSLLIVSLFLGKNPRDLRYFLAALAGICIAPYFLYCSLYYYTDLTSLVGALLGIVFYQKNQHAGAAFCMALAVCARQYAVAFPAAIILYELLLSRTQKPVRLTSFPAILNDKYHLIWYGIPFAVLLGWWLFWGGLGPPAEMARQTYHLPKKGIAGFNVGFSLYSMACFGFYYALPEAVLFSGTPYFRFFRNKTVWAVILAGVLGALLWLFPVEQTRNAYFTIPFIDPLDRWLNETGFSFGGKQVVYGLLALICAIRFFTRRPDLSAVLVGTHVLMMGKTQIAWDKYVMPALVVLWLLNLLDTRRQLRRLLPASILSSRPGPEPVAAEQ